jgi:hypothetical protein
MSGEEAMASEILGIPEGCLVEFIAVVRAGLANTTVSEETRGGLTEWCDEHEEHLRELAADVDQAAQAPVDRPRHEQ